MGIVRNILAFSCTFYLIYFITSSVLNLLFAFALRFSVNISKKAAIIFGIIAASLLVPYYYYPV